MSTYGYVRGSPLNGSDSSGLFDIQARYGCTPTGGCGYSYKFAFHSGFAGVYGERAARAGADAAIRRARIPLEVYEALKRGEKVIASFDAKPTGSSEIPAALWKGVRLCADADKDFEPIFEGLFPNGANSYLSPEDAQKVLDAFEQSLFAKSRACPYADAQCRDPYHRLLNFYEFPTMLSRAGLHVDVFSDTVRGR
jgi:hypothetical protein